jgi:galactonate dehydratase
VKITDVQAVVCNARMRNWIFVKVVTDQPGLIGWGEATLEWHTHGVVGAIRDLSELLVGQDPRRIEYLWQMMYRQHFWHGNGVVRSTAISGIDIALWDIAGKILGVPCHRLWGGRVRDNIRLYCHLGGGSMEKFYETSVTDYQAFADLATAAVEDGFTAMKSMAVPPTMPLEGTGAVRHAAGCVAAMREAVGPDIDLMVDCHARPSPAMGLRFAHALDDFGLLFLEEPCWPESVEGLARINAATQTPIASGERVIGQQQFRALFEASAIDVCQFDITHVGGLTEARRVAAMADAYRISLAPHNPQGPVSTAASLEFGFSQPGYVICESVHADVPWRVDIVTDAHEIQPDGRLARPHDRPGLGIELDEAEIAKHPFEPELPQRVFYPDGAVGDW